MNTFALVFILVVLVLSVFGILSDKLYYSKHGKVYPVWMYALKFIAWTVYWIIYSIRIVAVGGLTVSTLLSNLFMYISLLMRDFNAEQDVNGKYIPDRLSALAFSLEGALSNARHRKSIGNFLSVIADLETQLKTLRKGMKKSFQEADKKRNTALLMIETHTQSLARIAADMAALYEQRKRGNVDVKVLDTNMRHLAGELARIQGEINHLNRENNIYTAPPVQANHLQQWADNGFVAQQQTQR